MGLVILFWALLAYPAAGVAWDAETEDSTGLDLSAMPAERPREARPPASAPAPTIKPVPDVASKYRLNTGDHIRIDVFGEKDLTVEAILTDSGTISYPFLGEILVKGLTISELAALITRRLKGDYLRDPQVSVNLVHYRAFYVNGEVARPGEYPYKPGLTVHKAITMAGGFTERASRTDISIIREDDPRQEPKPASLNEPINPGDVLIVEESFF